jgi:hypothetical protein
MQRRERRWCIGLRDRCVRERRLLLGGKAETIEIRGESAGVGIVSHHSGGTM